MLEGTRRPRPVLAGLGAAAYAAAFLLKPSGLVYGLAPVLAMLAGLAVPASRAARRRSLIFAAAVLVVAAGLVLGGLALLGSRLGVDDGRAADGRMGFIQCPPVLCQGNLAEQWRATATLAPALPEVLALDFGWPLIALAALAPLEARGARRLGALYVAPFEPGRPAFFLIARPA